MATAPSVRKGPLEALPWADLLPPWMITEDEITLLPTTDLETQLLLGDLFGKARKIKGLGGLNLKAHQVSWFGQRVDEMELFMQKCLEENSEASLVHLALRLKQLFTRIWINHAREEEELGDGKDVGPEQKNVARALTLLKRNKLGAAIKQLEGLGLAPQDEN